MPSSIKRCCVLRPSPLRKCNRRRNRRARVRHLRHFMPQIKNFPAAASRSAPNPTLCFSRTYNMKMEKIKKSDAEWKQQLTPEQYHVAREKGTERPFTGDYNKSKDKGVYTCVCC